MMPVAAVERKERNEMRFFCWLLLAVFSAFPVVSPGAAETRQIVGYVERVQLLPGGAELTAKLDTGAKTSSLDVSSLEYFTKAGEDWVRFTITGIKGKDAVEERPLVRMVTIRRADTPMDRRPVVKIGLCLGHFYKEADVNLTYRPKMSYRLLLGRLFLSGPFLIDARADFLTEPACKKAGER